RNPIELGNMAQNIQSYVPGIRELKLEEPMDASLTPGNHTESAAQNTANAEVEGFLKSVLEDFAASYSYFRGFVKGRQQLEDAINGFKTISNLDFVIREAQPSPLNDGAPSPRNQLSLLFPKPCSHFKCFMLGL
ncbi:unnamed protein product, partial [Owenia fusiformis]